MDDILFFGGSTPEEAEDLPWGKDWVKGVKPEIAQIDKEVISCYVGDKGILVETGEYKTFIFNREKVCKFLKEALQAWVIDEIITKPLIVAYLNKKFCYGLNQSKPDVIWIQTDNKYTSMRFRDDPSTNAPKIPNNPFLPPSNSPASPEDGTPQGKRSFKKRPLEEPGGTPK